MWSRHWIARVSGKQLIRGESKLALPPDLKRRSASSIWEPKGSKLCTLVHKLMNTERLNKLGKVLCSKQIHATMKRLFTIANLADSLRNVVATEHAAIGFSGFRPPHLVRNKKQNPHSGGAGHTGPEVEVH